MLDYHIGRFIGYLTYPSILIMGVLFLAKLDLTPWQIAGAAFAYEVIGSTGAWLRYRAAERELVRRLMEITKQ